MVKKLIFILMSFQSFALDYGECRPIADSKRYISSNFSMAYPKEVSFSCLYECSGDSLEEVRAISRITVRNMEQDAKLVVCQGVEVIKKSWGYDFDRIRPFFVYDTHLEELKIWGVKQEINLNNPAANKLSAKLIDTLEIVSRSFAAAGINSVEFKIASEVLLKMSRDLALVDEVIDELRAKDFKVSKEYSAQNLVYSVVLTHAYWRILPKI